MFFFTAKNWKIVVFFGQKWQRSLPYYFNRLEAIVKPQQTNDWKTKLDAYISQSNHSTIYKILIHILVTSIYKINKDAEHVSHFLSLSLSHKKKNVNLTSYYSLFCCMQIYIFHSRKKIGVKRAKIGWGLNKECCFLSFTFFPSQKFVLLFCRTCIPMLMMTVWWWWLRAWVTSCNFQQY